MNEALQRRELLIQKSPIKSGIKTLLAKLVQRAFEIQKSPIKSGIKTESAHPV